MSTAKDDVVSKLRDVLREAASRLALDPDSITSPTPAAIVGRTRNGSLLRLDVRRYESTELSL